jgi:mannose-6-phosphate isomerase-like protein (cupin superfamily)
MTGVPQRAGWFYLLLLPFLSALPEHITRGIGERKASAKCCSGAMRGTLRAVLGAATTSIPAPSGTEKGNAMKEYVGPIEGLALKNNYFRQVLFTAEHAQLVLMCLQPGEEIGDEVHANVDQFFRIEQGEARFVFDEKKERLVRDGDAVVVPAKTFHNVINASKTEPLKLYTIYSPPNHPDGTVHKTKLEAEAAEKQHV